MSEDARAVTEYTGGVNEELKEKGAEKVFSLGDIRLYECPVTFMAPETWEVIRLVSLIEDTKVLLHEGGWGNQPAWLVEAFEIFKSESVKRLKNG
mgnify:FL=1